MLSNLIDAFEQMPWLFLATVFLLGLMVGSFLNVVIYRLPEMMRREWRRDCLEFLEQPAEGETERFNLLIPRSRCGHCGHAISPLENIPVVSWIALGGKCRECGQRISLQYPLVELFTAVVSITVAWRFGVSEQTVAALLFSWALIAMSGIDIGHKLLPDSLTLPMLWLGILLSFLPVFVDLENSIIGAMAGYLSLWSVYIVFKLITGKEGMGHGDFKLLAMIGAWTGWKLLLVVILTASLAGAIIGISMIALKKTARGTQTPFGPYLAIAGWIALLWGDELQRFYFALL